MNNTLNLTELATGKDGRLNVLLNGTSYFLAEIDTFKTIMNFESVDIQPVGAIVKGAVPTGVTIELTFTEMVIRDDLMLEPLIEAVSNGYVPVYVFEGIIEKPDKSDEERVVYRDCLPAGSFDLQNLVPGEVVKRERAFRVNSIPKLIQGMVSKFIKSA